MASSGIEKLECDTLKLQSFQTRTGKPIYAPCVSATYPHTDRKAEFPLDFVLGTGIKFVLTAEPGTPDLDNVLHGIYELYSDYVLKVRAASHIIGSRSHDSKAQGGTRELSTMPLAYSWSPCGPRPVSCRTPSTRWTCPSGVSCSIRRWSD